MLKNRQFLYYTLAGSLCSVGMFGYVASAPTIFLTHFHMEQKQFGWMIGSISIGVVLASQLNNFALRRIKMNQVALIAAAMQILIGIVFFVAGLSGMDSVLVTIGFIAVLLACLGFIFPNAGSLAMAPMDKDAGDASAYRGHCKCLSGPRVPPWSAPCPKRTL